MKSACASTSHKIVSMETILYLHCVRCAPPSPRLAALDPSAPRAARCTEPEKVVPQCEAAGFPPANERDQKGGGSALFSSLQVDPRPRQQCVCPRALREPARVHSQGKTLCPNRLHRLKNYG